MSCHPCAWAQRLKAQSVGRAQRLERQGASKRLTLTPLLRGAPTCQRYFSLGSFLAGSGFWVDLAAYFPTELVWPVTPHDRMVVREG